MTSNKSIEKLTWRTPANWVALKLPNVPKTPQGFNKNIAKTAPENQKRSNKGQGGGFEYHYSLLCLSAQTALLKRNPEIAFQGELNRPEKLIEKKSSKELDHASLWANYERKTQKAKDRAEIRLRAVDMVEALIRNGWKKGCAKEEVVAHFNTQTKITFATLGRWMKLVAGHPRCDWVVILADSYTGRISGAECSPQAWDYFKADFLRLSAPAAQACYERLQRVAKEKRWVVPSIKTLMRKIDQEVSQPVQVLARKGDEALSQSYPAQTRDHGSFAALEAVNADGHKFDVFVRYPDGEIGRPVMVAWQDIYSGKILSYRVDRTENSDSVRLSFGDLVETYGIPGCTFLDNGRGFAAKYLTGGAPTRYRFKIKEEDPVGILTTLMGKSNIHWCTPYHGQSKPIERAFRDMAEYVAKHPHFEGAYTGNTPMAKPENYGSHAVPWDEFKAVLDQEIVAHNARVGRRSPVCAGRSFDQAFSESYAKATIRKATPEQRRLWLLAAEGVTTSRKDGSITLLDNRYYADCLASLAGQKLVVRFDPDNLHSMVHVYRLDGSYIGEADYLPSAGFADTQAAREHNRLRNQYKKTTKEQLQRERRMDHMEAAKMLPALEAPESPQSKVVKPIFNNSKPSSLLDDVDTDDRVHSAIENVMNRPGGFLKKSVLD